MFESIMRVHEAVRVNDVVIELVEWHRVYPPDQKYQVVLSDRDVSGLPVDQHTDFVEARRLYATFVKWIATALFVPAGDPLRDELPEHLVLWERPDGALVALDAIPEEKRLLYKLKMPAL